jgi:hypothetical protein
MVCGDETGSCDVNDLADGIDLQQIRRRHDPHRDSASRANCDKAF